MSRFVDKMSGSSSILVTDLLTAERFIQALYLDWLEREFRRQRDS